MNDPIDVLRRFAAFGSTNKNIIQSIDILLGEVQQNRAITMRLPLTKDGFRVIPSVDYIWTKQEKEWGRIICPSNFLSVAACYKVKPEEPDNA